jgi:hypothetical protein
MWHWVKCVPAVYVSWYMTFNYTQAAIQNSLDTTDTYGFSNIRIKNKRYAVGT